MKKNKDIIFLCNGTDKPMKWKGSEKLTKGKIPKPKFIVKYKKRII